jgi:DNA-binding protein Fis
MAVIQAEPDRALMAQRLREGRIAALWPAPEIDERTVLETTRIVAMMGAEPLQAALEGGADVVLAGRCSDSALFAAIPLMHGYEPGLAWHLGKTIECAGAIIRPKTGQDCVVGILRRDHFLVEPAHPDKRCTTETVASHTMYENPSPYEFIEPAGIVDTRNATYTAEDHRVVRVTGSQFEKAKQYTVKLEGADLCGHRAMVLAGISDPILIRNIDSFTAQIAERTSAAASDLGIAEDSYTLVIRRYGLDAVIPNQPKPPQNPIEIGLVIEAIAATPSDAAAIIAKARYNALHTEFEGRMCTAGNLALPFAPSDIDVGRAYRFSVWHAMELDDPLEVFPIQMLHIGGDAQ